ncbi:response regulator [Pseudomonas nitroreducens]|uniref:response regulator n=1 Tax=Pseudomonas nitroreducens TaxID=46680 RepID=UPI0014867C43|nr:response regulator [Pseudomonas nitroreducens]
MNIQDCSADERIILIVEDEATLAFLIQLVMDEVGISALIFGSAEDALAILRQEEYNVQLVLADVNLAGEMSGIGLSVLLACEFPNLPVILMSAAPQIDVPSDRLFLRKPIGIDQLISAVKSNMVGK